MNTFLTEKEIKGIEQLGWRWEFNDTHIGMQRTFLRGNEEVWQCLKNRYDVQWAHAYLVDGCYVGHTYFERFNGIIYKPLSILKRIMTLRENGYYKFLKHGV